MPKRIVMDFIRPGHPGAYARFPFKSLLPGDELAIPMQRCNKVSVDAAVLRFMRHHNPLRIFRVTYEAGDPYIVVTRVE